MMGESRANGDDPENDANIAKAVNISANELCIRLKDVNIFICIEFRDKKQN